MRIVCRQNSTILASIFNKLRDYTQQIEGFDGIIRFEVGAQLATGISSITFRAYGPSYGGQWRRDTFAKVALEE
jgi:hypothetical protein